MNKPVAWPEKAWLYDDGGDLIDCGIPDCDGITVEYIRADLAQPQFTPEQLQSVLDAFGMSWENADALQGRMESEGDLETAGSMELEKSKIESAIAILKGHLHG